MDCAALDDRALEALLSGRGVEGEDDCVEIVKVLASVSAGPVPVPSRHLGQLLEVGFEPAPAPPGERTRTRMPSWVRRVCVALAVGLATTLTAGAANALPAGVQRAVAGAVDALTPFELPVPPSAGRPTSSFGSDGSRAGHVGDSRADDDGRPSGQVVAPDARGGGELPTAVQGAPRSGEDVEGPLPARVDRSGSSAEPGTGADEERDGVTDDPAGEADDRANDVADAHDKAAGDADERPDTSPGDGPADSDGGDAPDADDDERPDARDVPDAADDPEDSPDRAEAPSAPDAPDDPADDAPETPGDADDDRHRPDAEPDDVDD